MTWQEIDYVVLESAAASVVFDSGLTGFKFFRLSGHVVSTGGLAAVLVRLNGDTGTNYVQQYIAVNGTSVGAARQTGQTSLNVAQFNVASGESGSLSFRIAKPAAGVKAQLISDVGTNASPTLTLLGGEWNNTSDAISSITVLTTVNNYAIGSSFLLEGLA